MSITSKNEFDHASAALCGRMVSLDADTRKAAAVAATELLVSLPKDLKNSPHIKGETAALATLIARVG